MKSKALTPRTLFWNSTEWGPYKKGMKPPQSKPATMPTSIWRRVTQPNQNIKQSPGKPGFFKLLKYFLQWIAIKLNLVSVAAR